MLPSGFQRIRHYGFLANRARQAKLARCRQLLAVPPPVLPPPPQDYRARYERLTGRAIDGCPRCHQGRLVRVEVVPRSRAAHPGARGDSS